MLYLITGRKAHDAYAHAYDLATENQSLIFPNDKYVLTPYPELDPHKWPLHAENLLQYMQGYLTGYQSQSDRNNIIVTMHELPFLYVCKLLQLRKLKPEDVQVIYVAADGKSRVLRLNQDGEFLDTWPDGFFAWRGKLLFEDLV